MTEAAPKSPRREYKRLGRPPLNGISAKVKVKDPAERAFYELFGTRVKRAREGLGLSRADLGARCIPPRSETSIRAIECAEQRLHLRAALELASLLRTDIAKLTRPSKGQERWEALRDEP